MDRSEVFSTFKAVCCFIGVAPVQANALGRDCEDQSWSVGEVGKLHGPTDVSPRPWSLFL